MSATQLAESYGANNMKRRFLIPCVPLVLVLVLAFAACVPVGVPTLAAGYSAASLNGQGNDAFNLTRLSGDQINATAAAWNTSDGPRNIYWQTNSPEAVNEQVCTTWVSQRGATAQQGMALRIREDGSRLRAVVMTKNVYLGGNWAFNLYVIDKDSATGADHGSGLTTMPLEALLKVPGQNAAQPLPWRVCAKIEGDLYSFKIWRTELEAEPAYGDGIHGASFTLPATAQYAGKAGLYMAHMRIGDSAVFTDPAVTVLP